MNDKEYLQNTLERIFHLEQTGINECKQIISILESNDINVEQLKLDINYKF